MTEKFHFMHAGEKYSIPYMSSLKVGITTDLMEAMSKAEEAPHRFMRVIEDIAAISGPETRDAIRDMTNEEFSKFHSAWLDSTPGVSGK